MSGNSCASALQTVPIVIDFCRGAPVAPSLGSSSAFSRSRSVWAVCVWVVIMAMAIPISLSTRVEGQLVLADLHLIALLQALGLDPLAIDVGPVQRATVIDVLLT